MGLLSFEEKGKYIKFQSRERSLPGFSMLFFSSVRLYINLHIYLSYDSILPSVFFLKNF